MMIFGKYFGLNVFCLDWLIAHRAAGLDAPENSIEALQLAAKNGAKIIEFDVSFTSCMSPVVFHDDTVDRVTQATGHISSHTHSNLKKLNLATKHPLGSSFEFSGIPDLEEFVAECMKLNMKMIIDLKTYEVPEETISVILNLYKKFPGMKSCTLVTSFFPHLLYQLRRKDPEIVCSLSYRPHFFAFSTYEGTNVSMKPRYNIFIINH